MRTLNNSNFTPKFTSRFEVEEFMTKRSLVALERALTDRHGNIDKAYDSFISSIETDGKNDVFSFRQFEKFFELTNLSTNKVKKFKIHSLLTSIKDFIITSTKKAPN